MELTEEQYYKALDDIYRQGRFDEYADRTGRKQAKAVRDRLNRQKNCPYCHSGHQLIYEKDNSVRLVRINLRGNKKHPYCLNVTYKNKLIEDDYEPGGWVIKNPAEHYRTAINYCPMCGRPLGGNEDE